MSAERRIVRGIVVMAAADQRERDAGDRGRPADACEPPREIDTAAPAHGGRRRRWRRDIAFGEHRHVDDHGGASGGLFRRHEARAIRRRSSDIDRAWIDQLADLRAWLYDAPADRDR